MNLSSYKTKIKRSNAFIVSLLVMLLLTSCIEEKDYRKPENFVKLMDKTITFADDFNNKDKNKEVKSLLDLNFKIHKEKKVKTSKDDYIYYLISIPYNLRGDKLDLFLEEFSSKYLKKYNHLVLDMQHMGAEPISGIFARYEAKLKGKTVKLETKLINHCSEKSLTKKGIKHFMLPYDFRVLNQISSRMKSNKHLSLKSASLLVSEKYKITPKRMQQILNFTKLYYQKNDIK